MKSQTVFAASAAALVLFATAHPVMAQVAPPAGVRQQLPSEGDISRSRVPLPPPPETPQFDLRIQAPDRSAVPKSVDAIEFQLTRIDVVGATAFPTDVVNGFFAPLLGKTVHLGDVRDAAAKLEALYKRHGYFLSRVFVPPQTLEGDTLQIRVVEGYIGAVHVEGLDSSTQHAVQRALASLVGKKPIDLPSVERALLTLNDIPGMTAASVLRQGTEPGSSDMTVTLAAPKNSYVASVDNTNSKILGPWDYALAANINRPLGGPGNFTLGLTASGPALRASQSASARYSFGIGANGLILSLGGLYAKANPQGSLQVLDIRNNVASVSARLRYPLIRSRASSLYLEGGLAVTRSTTDILGFRLIEDQTTDADVGLTYVQNGWAGGTTTFNVDVFHGLPILGASKASALQPSVLEFNPKFTRVTYSVQRLQPLPKNFSLLLGIQGQYSVSTLLSGELVAFGGPAIGRGYDPSVITGDRGVGGIAELRYDIAVGKPWLSSMQVYGFIDGARATTVATSTTAKVSDRIRSAGFGLRAYEKFGSVDVQFAQAHYAHASIDPREDPRVSLAVSFVY